MESKKINSKRIFLTGGHAATAAYATIQELRRSKDINWDIYWIGSRRAVEGKSDLTFESRIFPKIGVKFVHLITGRIQRKFTIWTIPSLFKIPIGFVHALIILIKHKPSVILSFGASASFPIVVLGWVMRIPIILHEQTIAVGRANLFSAKFAKIVALSRIESQKYFPKNETIVVGNPISDEIKSIKPKNKLGNKVVILITGGSRGSEFINDLVGESLDVLLEKYHVIHQTGTYQYDKFTKLRDGMDELKKKNYEVHSIVYPWDWYKFIEKSDILVSRAGANTVSEVLAVKRPTIFIPLPFSYLNEQTKNAEYAKDFGIAEVLDQKATSSQKLISEISNMVNNWSRYTSNVKDKESPDLNASVKLVKLIRNNLK